MDKISVILLALLIFVIGFVVGGNAVSITHTKDYKELYEQEVENKKFYKESYEVMRGISEAQHWVLNKIKKDDSNQLSDDSERTLKNYTETFEKLETFEY